MINCTIFKLSVYLYTLKTPIHLFICLYIQKSDNYKEMRERERGGGGEFLKIQYKGRYMSQLTNKVHLL